MTNYATFLARVIDDGIEAARRDYAEPRQANKLRGAVAGFEACRGKSPVALAALLAEARERTMVAYREQADNYWEVRCFEAEVEWTCNVVSAAFHNQGLSVIVPPTMRGALKAAEILGVA